MTGTPAAHRLTFNKVRIKVRSGKSGLKISGKLSPAPALKGTTVKLYAYSVTGGRNREVGHVKVGAGKRSFTVSAKLVSGRYVLQLEYTQKGQTTVYSGLRTVTVK